MSLLLTFARLGMLNSSLGQSGLPDLSVLVLLPSLEAHQGASLV